MVEGPYKPDAKEYAAWKTQFSCLEFDVTVAKTQVTAQEEVTKAAVCASFVYG